MKLTICKFKTQKKEDFKGIHLSDHPLQGNGASSIHPQQIVFSVGKQTFKLGVTGNSGKHLNGVNTSYQSP